MYDVTIPLQGTAESPSAQASATYIQDLFVQTRARSEALAAPLSPEDMMIQSMEDASPTKWHLGHTSWFFEEFILRPYCTDYRSLNDQYRLLFNSYYVQAGFRHIRSKRGLLSRPDSAAILGYRRHVTFHVLKLLHSNSSNRADILKLVELGCHHEMQHQELMLTDILHGLSYSPLLPSYHEKKLPKASTKKSSPIHFTEFSGGLTETGHDASDFHFDCEAPRHKEYLPPFALGVRPVTNAEWIAFIEDGGYEKETLWLSDGWAYKQKEGWTAPLYWWKDGASWNSFTLTGVRPVDPNAPVSHISYYEADAYARWAGARLPTEAEHETAFRNHPIDGNFADSELYIPSRGPAIWGDVWEWTQSPYTPYPGYQPVEGTIGEYNGKFMVNQFVLRGGSCLTPRAQMRPTYRNFFHPHQRWQMTGLRLAKDL
ncbi:ergothioneine biosynthesis protein EgtB [Kordiimonas sediminis]|uniref:Ergothioneine biosynthesis protein EgtB n=1 Tax=Kordiimonas sediminis TaxID=1735581 RepID=A0A919AXN8_9PROT|nr:ergothioneine biosynthesis protein EgtB [Kordiimonas sediminis]GHF31277.1 ergothioneine biosynthesis protein EgtB [Kordiimonas sediminis]